MGGMDDPKMLPLSKGVWTPPLKNISFFFEEQSVSFFCSPVILFLLSMSPCAVHPPNVFFGGFYLHRSSFSKKSLAVPLASHFSWATFHPFSLITSLCSLAVLHYILLKNIWEDSKVARLCMSFCWCFTRFYQDLGWFSCLRSPTFRHLDDHLVIRVSPDCSASICCLLYILFVIGASFRCDRMGTLVTGISNPMAALRRSSSPSGAASMTWLRKGFLVFDSFDLGGLICLVICLINSIIGLAFDDERFVFSTIGFVRCGSFSWLKGERPGTRTLAACRQKIFFDLLCFLHVIIGW